MAALDGMPGEMPGDPVSGYMDRFTTAGGSGGGAKVDDYMSRFTTVGGDGPTADDSGVGSYMDRFTTVLPDPVKAAEAAMPPEPMASPMEPEKEGGFWQSVSDLKQTPWDEICSNVVEGARG
jgi:hypothetical protein